MIQPCNLIKEKKTTKTVKYLIDPLLTFLITSIALSIITAIIFTFLSIKKPYIFRNLLNKLKFKRLNFKNLKSENTFFIAISTASVSISFGFLTSFITSALFFCIKKKKIKEKKYIEKNTFQNSSKETLKNISLAEKAYMHFEDIEDIISFKTQIEKLFNDEKSIDVSLKKKLNDERIFEKVFISKKSYKEKEAKNRDKDFQKIAEAFFKIIKKLEKSTL